MMEIIRGDTALKYAVELAGKNLENASEWVEPDKVTDFVEKVYDFLVHGGTKNDLGKAR